MVRQRRFFFFGHFVLCNISDQDVGELKGKTGSADGLYPKEFGVNANSQMTCTLWKEHTNYSIEDTRALKVRPGRKGKLSELFKSSFNLN